jgi:hypothetical protein
MPDCAASHSLKEWDAATHKGKSEDWRSTVFDDYLWCPQACICHPRIRNRDKTENPDQWGQTHCRPTLIEIKRLD